VLGGKKHTTMKLLTKVVGVILSVVSIVGALVSFLALIDPREAQLSNDADPFGAPPTTAQSLLHLTI